MPTRRSRNARAKKTPKPAPVHDVGFAPSAIHPIAQAVPMMQEAHDPSETAQLRALEAGWDELLA